MKQNYIVYTQVLTVAPCHLWVLVYAPELDTEELARLLVVRRLVLVLVLAAL